jgi:hypothetical protein
MEKQAIKTEVYRLRRERQLLETRLLNTGRQMEVWVTSQYTYCRKGNCKCTRGQPHGPFYYLFFKEGGRVWHRYLPRDKSAGLRKSAETYRNYQKKMARLNKLNQEIAGLLRQHQQNNLLPIPPWLKKKKRPEKV